MTKSRIVLVTARVLLLCFLTTACLLSCANAQTVATLGGQVVDQSGAIISGVAVTAANIDTGLRRDTTSGTDGHFTLPSLAPGKYIIKAEHAGFQTAELRDVVLTVNDQRAVRIELNVASVGETVHVEVGVGRVATSPAVSTVVDHQFVSNLPLSGRSLQSLLELTPGVTLFKASSSAVSGGQFSINGQHTNANYFMVDGVSGNTAITTSSGGFAGHSGSGALPALTALGSTQSLVSIDALQEFRVQTSTYSPEFGRMPGGQISMLTRSGSNSYHGSISEYFRHNAMDATDWFANAQGLAKPKLRQNDFGGTFGGPIIRNHTFFFGSYEGLRLDQPQAKVVGVPTIAVRQQAPAAMRTLLDAFPLPTGRDLGNGTAEFAVSYSDPSRFDSTAVRLDHSMGDHLTLFGRYSHAPSISHARAFSLNTDQTNQFANDSLTGGATGILGNSMTNDVRVNYTRTRGTQARVVDTLGGAVIPPVDVLFQPSITPEDAFSYIIVAGTNGFFWGTGNDNYQRQFNLVDTLTWVRGLHTFKFGADYRRISPTLGRSGGNFAAYIIGPVANALAGRLSQFTFSKGAGENVAVFNSFSLFAQDTWTAASRLTLTYGVRWELNPSPTSANGHQPYVIADISAPEPVSLAPKNTPLYQTTYNNFAPRLGATYQLAHTGGNDLLLRGGFGVFYDTGFGESAVAFDNIYPLFASATTVGVDFPLSPAVAAPPLPGTGVPQQFWLPDRHVKLPYTYQWNVSLEQRLGGSQSLTLSYVGSSGQRLLRRESYNLLFQEFGTTRVPITYFRNSGTSAYKALQVQFQRRLSRGLQALVNYTLSKSTDTVSDDAGFLSTFVPAGLVDLSTEHGPSDFDVRHVLTGGLTYEIPAPSGPRLVRQIFGNWGVDGLLRARSAFPLTLLTSVQYPNTTYSVRPDVVPGIPEVLTGPQYPGGKALNPAAFSKPLAGTVGNYSRNSLRGFPAQQVDLTLRRQIALGANVRAELRFESFNLFNHPNFADPSVTLTDSTFGLSTQMLNRGLGSLNALYQMGGPRSSQIAVKLLF